jgi:hypothetical protein
MEFNIYISNLKEEMLALTQKCLDIEAKEEAYKK